MSPARQQDEVKQSVKIFLFLFRTPLPLVGQLLTRTLRKPAPPNSSMCRDWYNTHNALDNKNRKTGSRGHDYKNHPMREISSRKSDKNKLATIPSEQICRRRLTRYSTAALMVHALTNHHQKSSSSSLLIFPLAPPGLPPDCRCARNDLKF